ncbi:hypothetical protein R3W88_032411 [Solanum pinnatisectum]|uniref:Polygalacturonase n=1 Tax=Solanum pinnatisectum TaxID=50273 RepID=A0AAV9LP37_9SOLN|nr:hypothetical protein R3W88_032411 [Solanum pinnatisectum]
MSGGGILDGQGKAAWECRESKKCTKLPNNLSFNSLTNSIIKDITTLDSKSFDVNVNQCKNLTFLNFNVSAPASSPNTDGIHISRSSSVNVTDSNFATGDDCISIGNETEQLYITKVTCGPGYGISVGSLGGNPDEKLVLPSQVKISKVTFLNIKGTSRTQSVVSLICSKGSPCESVEVGDIDISYSGKEGPAKSSCENIKPNFKGKQSPAICSASASDPAAAAPAPAPSSSS